MPAAAIAAIAATDPCPITVEHQWRDRAERARGELVCYCGARKPRPISELVRGYRANHPGADAADLILWLIEDTDYRTWSPSELARAVKCTTNEAHDALRELIKLCLINTDGRGSISRYWNLRG